MNRLQTLLITDRNPHVRALLCREFASQGYRAMAAKDGGEVERALNVIPPPDLVILDPEMAGASGITILESIQRRRPTLPVVIHTFPMGDYPSDSAVFRATALVEKSGDVVELKEIVNRILERNHWGLRHESA